MATLKIHTESVLVYSAGWFIWKFKKKLYFSGKGTIYLDKWFGRMAEQYRLVKRKRPRSSCDSYSRVIRFFGTSWNFVYYASKLHQQFHSHSHVQERSRLEAIAYLRYFRYMDMKNCRRHQHFYSNLNFVNVNKN